MVGFNYFIMFNADGWASVSQSALTLFFILFGEVIIHLNVKHIANTSVANSQGLLTVTAKLQDVLAFIGT